MPTLADMLAGAIAPVPPEGAAPLLQQGRSRFPPGMLESMGLGAARGDPISYTDPLLNVGRSRFPPGLLESMGLGAARR